MPGIEPAKPSVVVFSPNDFHPMAGNVAPRPRLFSHGSALVRLPLLLALLASSAPRAAAITWTGGNGRWNTAGNWSTGTVPTANDDVTITGAVTVQVRNPGNNAVARTLTLGSGTSITSMNGRTLAVNQGITVNSGDATLNIPFTAGGVSQTGTGTLTIAQSGTVIGNVTVSGGGTLAFSGAATLSASSFSLASGSTLTVNFSNATTVSLITVSGNATLSGFLNVAGSNPSTAGSPYTIATSTGGTVSVSGLTLGPTSPSGYTLGVRTSGANVLLDVTQNPVAVDSIASTTGSCPGNVTWQHTVGANATDRYLIVGISTGHTGASAGPTSVTYGSQTMNLVTSDNAGTTQVYIYSLLAPARGTNTITLTFPAASTCFVVAGSVSYTGVNQATPIGTAVTATETGNTPLLATATVNVQRGDKIFGVLSSNSATSATPVQSGVTARWAALNGTEYGTAETLTYTGTTNSTATLSFNMSPSSSTFWSLSVVPIHAANPTESRASAPLVRASPAGTVLSWRLAPTSDVVGFRVWRVAAGRRELLTPGLVAGPVLASRETLLAGSEVGWVDSGPLPGASYEVESLHRDGSVHWATARQATGKAPPMASVVVGARPAIATAQPALRVTPADPPPLSQVSPERARQWQLAAGQAVKLSVSDAGVLHVPAESLFAAGIPVGAVASSLQLFREGHPVARTVLSADGQTLQPGDALEFYGYGMDTRYSGTAVYWLTAGSGTGAETATAAASSGEVGPTTFQASAEIRERLAFFGAARNGDAEKFFGPAVYGQPRQRTLTLEGLDPTATGARLEVALQGVTEVPHSVQLSVNGLAVGTMEFDGAVPGSTSIALPPGLLVPGDNLVGLVAPAAGDISLEQYVRIVYPRVTIRGTGPLDFTLTGGSATRLDGFDPAQTQVLDITDPDHPVRLATWSSSGAAAVAAPGTGIRRLLAYLPGDRSGPSAVTANQPSSWHSAEGADLVILGPAALFPGVSSLVDRRKSEGLSVVLVDIEDVQDEFASGEKSVDALRAFLSQALRAWPVPPRYVLLLGSASYDPRDYLGLGGDLVPSAAVETQAQEAVSDSWFLGFPGADALSIGRLPVHTTDEAQAVVAKIVGRTAATVHSPVLLVSDVAGTSDFPEMANDLQAELATARSTLLVRGPQPDDVLHQQFLDAARAGPALIDYAGHGSELFWAGDLHTVDDTTALAGGGTSLWVHMTCLTAFFQDPRRQSLAVATLLEPSGGAWAAWGSTGITYPADHPALNRTLVKALLVDGRTLGEATRLALAETVDEDVQSTFVLLGDPSARAVDSTSAALTVSTKTSSALGCSSPGGGSGTLAVLALVGLWLTASRRQPAVARRRRRSR